MPAGYRGVARRRRASLASPAFGGLVDHNQAIIVQTALVTLYVLRGIKSRKRYVGITTNLTRRLTEHRQKTSKGSQLIGEFELVIAEEYPTYVAAREREKYLKSGQGRQWLDQALGK